MSDSSVLYQKADQTPMLLGAGTRVDACGGRHGRWSILTFGCAVMRCIGALWYRESTERMLEHSRVD